MTAKLDLGLIAEGTVELDPMTGHYVVRIEDADGKSTFLDPQSQLEQYNGQEVRFIVTPLDTVGQIAKMVEDGQIDASQIPQLKLS